jgi:hypothetical protein
MLVAITCPSCNRQSGVAVGDGSEDVIIGKEGVTVADGDEATSPGVLSYAVAMVSEGAGLFCAHAERNNRSAGSINRRTG